MLCQKKWAAMRLTACQPWWNRRPLIRIDLANPFEPEDQIIDLAFRKVEVRHLTTHRIHPRRIFEKCLQPCLASRPVALGYIRRVVSSDSQNGMAVVAVVLLPDTLALYDFGSKLI